MFELTPEESAPYERRLAVLQVLLTLLFAGVALAYWRVQVIQGPQYQDRAEANRTRNVILRAPRGVILDRNGVLLVDSQPSYDAVVMREEIRDAGRNGIHDDEVALMRAASQMLRIGAPDMHLLQNRARVTPRFRPLLLKADLNRAEITFIKSHRELLPGVDIALEPRRNYVGGELLSHVLGYVGEIGERELASPRYASRLRPGDVIGRGGIESYYDSQLIGDHGEETLVVDSHGRLHGRTGERQDPVPGHTIMSTIDVELQRVAKEAFDAEGKNGAVVVLDPRNGEVLAMLSRPAYDPNLFSVRIARSDWDRLQQDPDHPLQNRAIQSRYPPGSTFKLLEAVAALEEGIATPQGARGCRGENFYFGRGFKCHKKGGHGGPDMRMAIQKSCNGFFYSVGNQLGIERIAKWGALFGLGRPTGIDLPNENPGILPSDAWKRKELGEKWYPGETISVAIGQGYVQVTPLQLATMYAAIGNGGTVYKPHLVRAILDLQGKVIKRVEPEVTSRAPMKPETVAFIRDALWSVVHERGTARLANVEGMDVCGKTGTAQVSAASAGIDAEKLDDEFRDHAWFAGFAPRDAPEIAFCVFVENGGHGGLHSAPIAKKILEAYFARSDREGRPARPQMAGAVPIASVGSRP